MITTLFPSILHTGKMPNHEFLKQKFMTGLAAATFLETNWRCSVDTTINQPFRETMDIFPWKEYFAGVTENISRMIQELGSPPLKSRVIDAWVNVYRDGQYQEPHFHIGRQTTCSVIYFANYV